MKEEEQKKFRIAELLAARFTGSITAEEELELEAWLQEEPARRSWVERMLQQEQYTQYTNKLIQYDNTEDWEKVETLLEVPVRKKYVGNFRLWWTAAAMVALLLGFGLLLRMSMTSSRTGSTDTTVAENVPPFPVMMSGAILILHDGTQVMLKGDENIELNEEDGTTILSGKTGLDYSLYTDSLACEETVILYNTVETPTGMEFPVTLSDGTRIYLNAESRLVYPTHFKAGEAREVELSGEAYFEVNKAEQPFLVRTSSATVKVLGTVFNVRTYPEETDMRTTLVEGSVELLLDNKGQLLIPGEMGSVNQKSPETIRVDRVDVAIQTAWRNGRFVFRNERLEDIFSYLSRWYGFTYSFKDQEAADILIGANISRYERMDPIVEMIRSTGQLMVELHEDQIIVSLKRSEE